MLMWQPYDDMAVDDVAVSYWQIWANGTSTHGIILVNGMVPRGPVMGCHMAPLYWLWFVNQNFV
jgi:hypothetical protein